MRGSARGSGKNVKNTLPLNRIRVLTAAVELADARGIAAVTMREVASQLGVEAMSLYNHIANKDDLLDGMIDFVIERIELPSNAVGWREAMRCRAVSAHQVFGRHPWAPQLLDSRTTSGPSRMRYLNWVLGTLVDAGFSLESASRAFSLLDSYIYGFGMQQFNMAAAGDDPPEAMAEKILAAIPAEQYPYLRRMAVHSMESGYDAEADFEFGLELILDGLEAWVSAGTAR